MEKIIEQLKKSCRQIRLISQKQLECTFSYQQQSGQKIFLRVVSKTNPKMREFQRDYSIRCRIDHPLVPKCYKRQQSGDSVIFRQEYCQGNTLQQILKQQKRTLENNAVITIVDKLLDLIRYFEEHPEKLAHRNLTPQCIILSFKSQYDIDVKVIDFRIAKSLQKPLFSVPKIKIWQYMAPQVMRQIAHNTQKTDFDTRCDLWSLGVIIFQVLTNNALFRVSSMKELYNTLSEYRSQPLEVYCERNNINYQQIKGIWINFIAYLFMVNYDFRIDIFDGIQQFQKLKRRFNYKENQIVLEPNEVTLKQNEMIPQQKAQEKTLPTIQEKLINLKATGTQLYSQEEQQSQLQELQKSRKTRAITKEKSKKEKKKSKHKKSSQLRIVEGR